jgi:hypothetical protein
MPQRSLFDEVADISREFWALSSSHEMLRNYTWQLGAICDLIKHTHSIVVHKLEAIEAATSLARAKALVTELEDAPLTSSFRANGLCDIFQGFGVALRQLTATIYRPDGTVETLPITNERKSSWAQFCDALENREREVASLYAHEIQEMVDLKLRAQSTQGLATLKSAARRARNILTSQMADFDSLATQFRQR